MIVMIVIITIIVIIMLTIGSLMIRLGAMSIHNAQAPISVQFYKLAASSRMARVAKIA